MSFLDSVVSSLKSGAGSSATGGVVGIDIGSSSMKVVELQEHRGVLTLVTYGELQLGPYVEKAVGEAVILDAKQEQQALVDVIRESAVDGRSAVFAMPLSSSFVTNVSLEVPDPEADIAALVRVEARKVIPASLSEVTLDWAEVALGDNKSKKEADGEIEVRDVLIAAIQNVALDRFRILMQFAGFKQPPTEIECFSSIRGLYNGSDSNVAIVDIGANSVKLYLVSRGLLARMYRVRAGGAVATKKIADTLGVDFESAEEIKCSFTKGVDRQADIVKAHHSTYDRSFREFGNVMGEFENKSNSSVETVYLSGGGSLFPGIKNHLEDILDREVIVANPFAKVAYPAFMEDTLKVIGPSFTVALGAAMRQFE